MLQMANLQTAKIWMLHFLKSISIQKRIYNHKIGLNM